MNALPSALPTLPPATPAAAGAPAAAEGDGAGFADALQQARQPQAQDGRPERAAAGERPREARATEARPAAPEATDRKAAPPEAEADDTTVADTGTTADEPTEAAAGTALLPPWLEAALARPARGAEALTPGRTTAEPTAAAPRARDASAAARGAAPTAAALLAQGAAEAAASRPATEPAGERTGFAAALQQAQAEGPRGGAVPVVELPAGPLAAAAGATPSGAAAASPARGEVAERSLPAPLHGPEFAPALGAQLNLLVRDGITEARLHLNPAEMGPISVQIQIDGQTARVEMAAEQAQTRQVLEQAMPVLAGALRESGLTLAGGGVFEQRREPQGEPGRHAGTPGPAGAGDGAGAEEAPRPVAVPQGMVDLYA